VSSKKDRQSAHKSRASRRLGKEVLMDILGMLMLCEIAPNKEKAAGAKAILAKHFDIINTELENGTVYEATVNRFYNELARFE